MDGKDNSINKKNSILLSRNNPIALVVGAGGFLGSHLVDNLLFKGIQVIGVDDLDQGDRQNLREAVENRNFHLLIESPDSLDLNLPRLDYIFIIPSGDWGLEKVFTLLKTFKSRCLLISSIDLYEKDKEDSALDKLRVIESKIARFSEENKLNARILRLGPVYGPRMDFKSKDALIRLIKQALTGSFQTDSLDFSSRALAIQDASDLMIKTILSGSTAQKIFDGILPTPIKVSEIKQVLMDPVWYESKGFTPTELPPWPTPNLDKTVKTLNWHPRQTLVRSLKETLSYFKESEMPVSKLEDSAEELETDWKKDKKRELEGFKSDNLPEAPKKTKKRRLFKFSIPKSKIYLFLVISLITYALIWPGFVLTLGTLTFYHQLNQGFKNLKAGEFEKSLDNIEQSSIALEAIKSIVDDLEPIQKTGFLKKEFKLSDDLFKLSQLSLTSTRSTILGTKALLQSVRAITGELQELPDAYFDSSHTELTSAKEDLSKASAILQREDFKKALPDLAAKKVDTLSEKLKSESVLVDKALALSILLPKLVLVKKDYLVLLQNNMELRPTGGFIGSFAHITFEGGKLKKLAVEDIYTIDGNLLLPVSPPKEIKEDLGQKDWYLRDSNWEPDFPASARQAEWFYTKETGERVDGVMALDISAMEELLSQVGPLDLPDYKEEISSENLFEKAISHAEVGFFPGSQAKKSFLTALTNGLFNKIFFLPQKNWQGIISSLGKSLDEKHISIYLNDPKLFSYIVSQNWTHSLPVASDQSQDFLSLVEANLGANKVNYYLDRNLNLETVVGKDGEIKHRLRVSYINRSPSETFPGGKYKNRMRVYLPFGSKLNRALWGEADVTKNVTGFVDYGRSGFSLLLELFPKEQKTLVLDYTVPVKLDFQAGKAGYRLDVIKQAGTGKDPLTWTISYPISYSVSSGSVKKTSLSPQEQTIQTDLSVDRSFEVEFKK